MAWARITDTFDDEDDTALMSDNAIALHICGITCANRLKTDGFISDARLLKLRGGRTTGLKDLIEGKGGSDPWWVKVDGGYQIRSFLKYNPSKQTREAKAEEAAARVAAHRESKRTQKPTKQPSATPLQADGNASCNADVTLLQDANTIECNAHVTHHVTLLPSHPIPSHPNKEIQEVVGTKNGEAPEIADPEPPAARLQPGSNFIFVGEPDPETGNPPDPVTRPMPKSVGAILGKSNPLAAFDPTKLPVPEGHDQDEINRKREALRRQREVIR
jgi:hypothetical protein